MSKPLSIGESNEDKYPYMRLYEAPSDYDITWIIQLIVVYSNYHRNI